MSLRKAVRDGLTALLVLANARFVLSQYSSPASRRTRNLGCTGLSHRVSGQLACRIVLARIANISSVRAWTFWGVDSAAAQLSDPFGTDANDLPTDRFVRNIHDEYLELVGTGTTSGSDANDTFMTLPPGVGSKEVKSE